MGGPWGSVAASKGGALSGAVRRSSRIVGLFLIVGLMAGCAGRPGADTLTPTTATAPGVKEETILVASTRARDPRQGTFFNGQRAPLSFAKVDMTVPPSHQAGEIEWPKTPPGNPATDMVVRDSAYLNGQKQFVADLNAELAKRPKGQRRVFIFVHGYNTEFSEALYRQAQLMADSDSEAVPVLFTWASAANTVEYVYDNNSATIARDALLETLHLVLNSNADQVSLLAHSMGNWVTMEALRQYKLVGKPAPIGKLGDLTLADPDIDIDVFKEQMRTIGKPRKPFFIMISHDDKALATSSFLAGGKSRLGDYGNDAELEELGAVVVDMTNIKALDSFNHGKFAQLAGLAPELRASIAARSAGYKPTVANVAAAQVDTAQVDAAQVGSGTVGTASPGTASLGTANPAPAPITADGLKIFGLDRLLTQDQAAPEPAATEQAAPAAPQAQAAAQPATVAAAN